MRVARSYASLYQHPPGGKRTSEEDQAFKRALKVMADVYASAVGTTVLQLANNASSNVLQLLQ